MLNLYRLSGKAEWRAEHERLPKSHSISFDVVVSALIIPLVNHDESLFQASVHGGPSHKTIETVCCDPRLPKVADDVIDAHEYLRQTGCTNPRIRRRHRFGICAKTGHSDISGNSILHHQSAFVIKSK